MSGHPRGIYWKDLNEVQRTTAQSVLGLDEASWDAGAPPPVVEVDPDSQTAPPPVSIKLIFVPRTIHWQSSVGQACIVFDCVG